MARARVSTKKKQKNAEREAQAQHLSEATHLYRPEYHMVQPDALSLTPSLDPQMPPDEFIPIMEQQRIETLPLPADEGVLVYDPDQPLVFPLPDAPKPVAKRESKTNTPSLSHIPLSSGSKSYSTQDYDHIRNTALSIGHPVLDHRPSRKDDLSAHRPMLRNAVSYGTLAFRAVFGLLALWISYKHMKHVVDDFVVQAINPKTPEIAQIKETPKSTLIRRESKAPVFLAKTIQSNP